ncbi:MAG: RimK family protein [Nitratireductor sp.]|nr:RimK family protein [Nitratireductor sp.]
MTHWLVLASSTAPPLPGETGHRVARMRDYLSTPKEFSGRQVKVINLASSYAYQSRGYYASLLAGARGHKVLPSVETINDLSDAKLYSHALPELEDVLNRTVRGLRGDAAADPGPSLMIYFGRAEDERFEKFARLVFDWFRAPILKVRFTAGDWHRIKSVGLVSLSKLKPGQRAAFFAAMAGYTARQWRDAKPQSQGKYSLAVLYDPKEELPPTGLASLKHFARIAGRLGVDVEPITRKDLARVANHDALFIRETTSIANHTYRFARRAQQEGMPVIDDPVSMIRCTNKVYLHELMGQAKIAMPPSQIISSAGELDQVADRIGFPVVVKTPDGSFSRGVKKADTPGELRQLVTAWLKETDLLITQKFMPTEFDWRVGVLGGRPIFVSQYTMAKKHWQIVRHKDGGKAVEGGFRPVRLADAPADLMAMAMRATAMIGNGLYGVDIKQTADGFFLIEINDNPNIEHGVEDASEKDEVWLALTRWFVERIERSSV